MEANWLLQQNQEANILFVTLWAPKTYQDFTEALRQTVERANTGEYLVANEEKKRKYCGAFVYST